MKKVNLFLFLLLLPLFSSAQPGSGYPVWTAHNRTMNNNNMWTIDWRPATAVIPPNVNIVPSVGADPLARGSAFTDCGDVAFHVWTDPVDFPNGLVSFHLVDQLGNIIPVTNGTSFDAKVVDGEVQIVRVPGEEYDWYLIYNQGSTAIETSDVLFSRVHYNPYCSSAGASIVNGLENIALETSPGVAETYATGKSTSAPGVQNLAATDHYLYLMQRTDGSNTAFLHRYVIDATGIHYTPINALPSPQPQVVQPWQFSASAQSLLELRNDGLQLAYLNKTIFTATLDVNENNFILFDFNAAGALVGQNAFDINDLFVLPDVLSPLYLPPFPTGGVPVLGVGDIVDNIGNMPNLGYFQFIGGRLLGIEYSPSGDYLYLSGGGSPAPGVQQSYLSHLLQIDLTSPAPPPGTFSVSINTQTVPDYANFDPTNGEGTCGSPNPMDSCFDWYRLGGLEKSFDGHIYMNKRRNDTIFIIPDPDNQLPPRLDPWQIDLSPLSVTVASNIIDPNPQSSPVTGSAFVQDQIDGYNYIASPGVAVTFDVAKYDCDSNCFIPQGSTSPFYQIDIIHNGNVITTIDADTCPFCVTFCADPLLDYDLDCPATPGIDYPNAISGGVASSGFYDFYEGDCCPQSAPGSPYTPKAGLINVPEAWSNKIVVTANVIVDGVELDITNVDVVFEQGTSISFRNGATLRASNSTFRTCILGDTWAGLDFDSLSFGLMNENVFKNADIAIDLFDEALDSEVSNNEFYNCEIGVQVSGPATAAHSLTGNTFVLNEQTSFTGDHTGINLNGTAGTFNLTAKIAQNDFVNTAISVPSQNLFGIMVFNASATILDNQFNDCFRAIDVAGSDEVRIEENDMDISLAFGPSQHQVRVSNSSDIWLSGNTITTPFDYSGVAIQTNSAIYLDNLTSVNVKENTLSGFVVGIQSDSVANAFFSENLISNTNTVGIYMVNNFNVSANCNVIDMDYNQSNLSSGIAYIQTFGVNNGCVIAGNCISETDYSIVTFASAPGMVIPDIRNNYLYNYFLAGLFNIDMSGDIGTGFTTYGQAGRNTFQSNNIFAGAIDINSSVPMTAYGNFGLAVVTSTVNPVGNNLYHSTATCGGQLSTAATAIQNEILCDDFVNVFNPFIGGGTNNYHLADDYIAALQTVPENQQLDLVKVIMLRLSGNDTHAELDAFHAAVSNQVLDGNNLYWSNYYHQLYKNDLVGARQALAMITPANDDEASLKWLEQFSLDLQDGNVDLSSLSVNELEELQLIDAARGRYAAVARDFLRQSAGAHDYRFEPIRPLPDMTVGDLLKLNQEGMLHIYPNPASDEIRVLFNLSEEQQYQLQLFDLQGRQISSQQLAFHSGQITMDVKDLVPGVYLVSITGNNGEKQQARWVKQ